MLISRFYFYDYLIINYQKLYVSEIQRFFCIPSLSCAHLSIFPTHKSLPWACNKFFLFYATWIQPLPLLFHLSPSTNFIDVIRLTQTTNYHIWCYRFFSVNFNDLFYRLSEIVIQPYQSNLHEIMIKCNE